MSKNHVIAALMALARTAAGRAKELDQPAAKAFELGREDGLREAIALIEQLS